MAEYDPPQPLWKRVVAGFLDFVLAFAVFVVLTAQVAGTGGCSAAVLARFPQAKCVFLSVAGMVAVLGLTVGYFVVLGKRVERFSSAPFACNGLNTPPRCERS